MVIDGVAYHVPETVTTPYNHRATQQIVPRDCCGPRIEVTMTDEQIKNAVAEIMGVMVSGVRASSVFEDIIRRHRDAAQGERDATSDDEGLASRARIMIAQHRQMGHTHFCRMDDSFKAVTDTAWTCCLPLNSPEAHAAVVAMLKENPNV